MQGTLGFRQSLTIDRSTRDSIITPTEAMKNKQGGRIEIFERRRCTTSFEGSNSSLLNRTLIGQITHGRHNKSPISLQETKTAQGFHPAPRSLKTSSTKCYEEIPSRLKLPESLSAGLTRRNKENARRNSKIIKSNREWTSKSS